MAETGRTKESGGRKCRRVYRRKNMEIWYRNSAVLVKIFSTGTDPEIGARYVSRGQILTCSDPGELSTFRDTG
jgi:hypothetical protein